MSTDPTVANYIEKLGDTTSKEVKPDFESGRAYYWMKATKEAMKTPGVLEKMPRKPRRGLKEESFWRQVDQRVNRLTFASIGVSFDANGKIIREENQTA